MRKVVLAVLLVAALPLSAPAAPRTVTLSVPGMDCPVCPITIKKALSRVNGVAKVDVSVEKHEATVTFDDTKTNVEALRNATANAGYPSTVKP